MIFIIYEEVKIQKICIIIKVNQLIEPGPCEEGGERRAEIEKAKFILPTMV